MLLSASLAPIHAGGSRRRDQGEAVQVDRITPMLNPPDAKRLKLKSDEMPFKFCFQFQLAALHQGDVHHAAERHAGVDVRGRRRHGLRCRGKGGIENMHSTDDEPNNRHRMCVSIRPAGTMKVVAPISFVFHVLNDPPARTATSPPPSPRTVGPSHILHATSTTTIWFLVSGTQSPALARVFRPSCDWSTWRHGDL
jgi:hypothetical protein